MPAGHVASYEDLLAFLSGEQTAYRHDAGLQVVQLAARSGPLNSFVFVRWERDAPYVQIIAPVVRDVPEDRVREIEDAICRLNHALVLPGFGYDFAKRFVYFRATLPRNAAGVEGEVLKRTILAVVGAARDFFLPLKAVVEGAAGARILAAPAG